MNKTERLELEKMVNENNVEDCTESIRNKRHSKPLRNSIKTMKLLMLKNKTLRRSNPDAFYAMLAEKCSFLFNNYTDIFNRIKKDELDLSIFDNFIDILEKIENNELDQHDGSFEVGKILKSIYIDSALKKTANIDKKRKMEEDAATATTRVAPTKNITWQQYKKQNLFKK